jgi:NAD(P)-dependent dehydrogenase (short-subunit alcohol dehydrogenase family)
MSKTVLITGAAGGIGQALCIAFKMADYRVIATDKESSGEVTCDVFIECDLEDICHSNETLEKFFVNVKDELEGEALNALVNNAAIQILGETENISINEWNRTLDINLTAPFLLTQRFIGVLLSSRGSVINIASVHARATKPGFVAYATSKSALVGLTQSLAIDLGGKVRVNAINPAATETKMLIDGFRENPKKYGELEKMHPINRIAKPEEVAQVAVFLASSKASFITGTTIDVDGGILKRLHDPD